MMNFYRTEEGKIRELEAMDESCWVNLVSPSPEEIQQVSDFYGLDQGMLRAALDEEETSRAEIEEEGTLLLFDIPQIEKDESGIIYSTIPLGIVLAKKSIITVCLKENILVNDFRDGAVKSANTVFRTQFVLLLLLRVANRYLQYLKQIDKTSSYIERQLHKSMRNKELIQLLDLEKSLVYFSTSLKANETTLEKILRGRVLKLYDEDQDLLEDVLIEIKQAIEMSNIYSNILSGTMDAFASIISNNLNIVMKVLTSITILMAIPTMIASFYGMNVTGLPAPHFWAVMAISVVATLGTLFLLKRKNML